MRIVRSLVCGALVLQSGSAVAQGTAGAAAPSALTPAQRYAEICPGRRESGTGAIVGQVRDVDDGSALSGAVVSTEWTDYTITAIGRSRDRKRRQETKTNGTGFFLLCGVPLKLRLDVRSDAAGVMAGPTPIVIDDRLIASMNFAVSRKDGGARTVTAGDSSVLDAVAIGSATLSGTVMGEDGRPLTNAELVVLGTQRSARTDAKGAFRLSRIPAGTRTIEVRSIGFEPVWFSTDLATNATRDTAVSINAHAQELAKVDVNQKKALPSWMERSGFEDRRIKGMGAFLTQGDIEKHGYSDLIAVLQGARGLRVDFGGAFPTITMTGGAARCYPTYFLDGIKFTGALRELSGIAPPDAIKRIEIYSNTATVPPQYYVMASNCGSIVIWTR